MVSSLRIHAASLILVLALSACASGVSFPKNKLGDEHGASETIIGFLSLPSGKGPFPAVVLLHSCGGMGTHVTSDWPNFLTKHGYAALTVDTFGSRGVERCPEGRRYTALPMWQDAYGALDYLAVRTDIDRDRIAVMGFSVGARIVENISTEDLKGLSGKNFKAGIAFYGGCDAGGNPSFPVLEIIGDRDSNAVMCPSKSEPYLTIKIIQGAYHAFDNVESSGKYDASDNYMQYNGAAVDKARQHTKDFLAKHLR